MNESTLAYCLERAIQNLDVEMDEEKFERILLIELHNYQFLNLRFPKWIGKAITKAMLASKNQSVN